jgi:hypothetical protein
MARPTVRWLRNPVSATRAAGFLWIAFALVVWNVIFDRVIVLAGREYVYSATLAAREGTYLLARDWMGRAVTRGVWTASAGAVAILVIGLTLIALARRQRTEG